MIRDAQQQNENATPKDFEIDVLMEALPHYFDGDGNFKMEKFQNMLQEEQVELSRDSYELNFLGKSYARLLASLETETVIVPNEGHNAEARNANSENVYITGDNLDALKHLAKSYRGKVKCIYIDPPYNTGNDGFIYNDTFNFTIESLVEMIDITELEAERILDLQGRASHSAWLTFMLPRLVLGRQLLTSDGVIFMSIDDNEVQNLRHLSDEIFGEGNFLADLIWAVGAGTQAGHFTRATEHVLVYARNKAELPNFRGGDGFIEDRATKVIGSKNPASNIVFPKGTRWDAPDGTTLSGTWGGKEQITLVEGELVAQDGKIVNDVTLSAGWSIANQIRSFFSGEETFDSKGQRVTDIFLNERGGVRYRKERGAVNPSTLLRDYGTTSSASDALEKLMGGKFFEYPKPVTLIKRLVTLVAVNNDIVMDFFSGSGSSFHAVLEANAEDGGTRRAFVVQLDEQLDEMGSDTARAALNAGYTSIDQLGRKRIELAADKIKQDTGADIDYGFKHYTLETPPQSVIDSLEDFTPDDNLFSDDPLEALDFDGTTAKNVLLSTWIVQDGYGLNAEIEKVTLQNYELTVVGNTAYAIDGGMSSDDIRVLTQKLEDGEIDITNFVYFHTAIGFERLRELDSALRHLRNRSSVTITARW